MTMKELEYQTPNGLHDADLLGLSVDYVKQTLTLDLNLWIGSLDGKTDEEREGRREAQIIVRKLKYCIIEPPDRDGAIGEIDGFETPAHDIERLGLSPVGAETFRHSIYVDGWNSFIHFAGDSAELVPADLIVREMKH